MPNNILEQVITYNESNLALLLNSCCFLNTANKKFENFDQDLRPYNLGDTVAFDLPPRFTTSGSLVATFQAAEQRKQQLVVDKAESVSYEFTAQQFIFNVENYVEKFARSAMAELGASVEADVASIAESNTFRFYGDAVNSPDSYGELANALAYFRNFGAAQGRAKCYLSDTIVPSIVNSGLNQFVLDRNEKEAMSWMLGNWENCDFYRSNLLKTHLAGTVGNNAAALDMTISGITLDANGAVTALQLTDGNAALGTDADAVKQYDKFQFSDGVSGQPNMRFLTFVGHKPSSSPVQFRAEADAASTANVVTVSIYPPLQSNAGNDQNINNAVAVGMKVSALPDHKCGLVTAGDPLFLAMPRLPEEVPFPTGVAVDKDSGASLRSYYGSLFGQNSRGMVHDVIWGKTLVDEYAMMLALPI